MDRVGRIFGCSNVKCSNALNLCSAKIWPGGGGKSNPRPKVFRPNMTTCLADALISLLEPPTAGSLGASRFGFQPHSLRQENQPIPLNDVLSDPVGESR